MFSRKDFCNANPRATYALTVLPDFDFVAARASMFHKHMSSWDEISGGGNSTLGFDFRRNILHWGEISGGMFYTG